MTSPLTREQWRTAILTAARTSHLGPRADRRPVVDHALDALLPELDRARAAGMREAAAMLRRYCPNHGDESTVTAFPSCHCPAADEIDRDAAAVSAPTT